MLLINYNEYLDLVVNTNNNVIKKLEDFLEIKNEKELVIPTKVPQSKEFTVNKINYYKNKEYMDFYTENELKMIQSHDLYLKLLHENFIK